MLNTPPGPAEGWLTKLQTVQRARRLRPAAYPPAQPSARSIAPAPSPTAPSAAYASRSPTPHPRKNPAPPLALAGPLTAPPKLQCARVTRQIRSEEHTSELQSRGHLVCRLLLEKK